MGRLGKIRGITTPPLRILLQLEDLKEIHGLWIRYARMKTDPSGGCFCCQGVWLGVFGGGGSSELLSGDRITPIYTPED